MNPNRRPGLADRIRDIPIGRRLMVAMGLILALSFASSVLAILSLQRMGHDVQAMVSGNVQTERRLADWLRIITNNVQRGTAISVSSDRSLPGYFAASAADDVKTANLLQQQIGSALDGPREHELFDRIGALRKTYLAARDAVFSARAAGDEAGAKRAFAERYEPTSKQYVDAMQAFMDLQRTQLDDEVRGLQEMGRRTVATLLAVSAASLLLATLLAWRLSRSITRPLGDAVVRAQAIGALDLSAARVDTDARDETGQLLKSMEGMRGKLVATLTEILAVADGVSSASAQIADGNHDLSTRTEQAAANLQETASSMEQITSTVQQTAASAGEAARLAESAVDRAQRGGAVVADVVATMREIDASARRIVDIIGVVDAIAFQTNILALNAAVEAARAGAHGRGFAVVAGEVRSLASRCADAAREIKALIGQSVERAESGTKLVQNAGRSMDDVVDGVRDVNRIIGEISAAAGEQSSGIAQINIAVSELDRMTQQNASLVEESAQSAEGLRQQAARLHEAMGKFTFGS